MAAVKTAKESWEGLGNRQIKGPEDLSSGPLPIHSYWFYQHTGLYFIDL